MPASGLTDEITDVASVSVDGVALQQAVADQLIEVKVDRSTGSASAARIRIDDASEASSTFTIGSTVTITMTDATAQTQEIFGGVVTSLGITIAAGRNELVIGAYDESFRLGQQSVTKSHRNVNPADLVRSVAKSANLRAETADVLNRPVFEVAQQTGTPHHFLTEIARSAGCEWFVRGDTLVVRPRTVRNTVELRAHDIRRFSARFSALEDVTSVAIRGWSAERKESFVGTANSNGTSSHSDVPVMKAGKGKLGATKALGFPKPLPSHEIAAARAEAEVSEFETTMLTGRGQVLGNAAIEPGALLAITGVADDWNGKYFVTEVQHVFGEGQPFVTNFTVGAHEPTTLVDLFGGSQSSSVDKLAGSLTIGIVTNVEDPEKLCRVKVQMPYLDDDLETDWVPVIQQGAGGRRGWIVLPEKGDEVVVGFQNGDLDSPLVLGGLWNGRDRPPVDRMGEKGVVGARSFTSRTGHQLVFSDGKGDDELFVSITLGANSGSPFPDAQAVKDKTTLFLGREKIELHADKTPISIKSGQTEVTIDKDDITLDARNISMKASGSFTVEARGGLEMVSRASAKVQAPTVDIKGDAKVAIDGGGMTEVKGGMVKIN